jgi:hypothetical protein
MTIPDAYNVNMASSASTTAATRARAAWFGRNGILTLLKDYEAEATEFGLSC